jgi:hypothetical protein
VEGVGAAVGIGHEHKVESVTWSACAEVEYAHVVAKVLRGPRKRSLNGSENALFLAAVNLLGLQLRAVKTPEDVPATQNATDFGSRRMTR